MIFFLLASCVSYNSDINVGPEVKKKTEPVVVKCEKPRKPPNQPGTSAKAANAKVKEKRVGM